MSDDDIYFEDDDAIVPDGEEMEETGVHGEEEEITPVEDLSTPEGKYAVAKESMGFDDDKAITLFQEVYRGDAPKKLRTKAIKNAAATIALRHIPDEITTILTEILQYYEDNILDDYSCTNIINKMKNNVLSSEECLEVFLQFATEKLNRNTQINLFLDLKLIQAETKMKYQDYSKAREMLQEAEQYCPIPPDPNDYQMCRSAIRILILHIEFADFDNKEEAMFDYYDQAIKIPKSSLNQRQEAVILQIQGLKLLKEYNFKEARSKFYDAFKKFDEAGSDKRIKCLPYWALSAMLEHETISIFMSPEVMHFTAHPVVAPISQLNEAYQINDIVLFNKRLPSAQKVFNNHKFYSKLLDDIRSYVLSGAIMKYTQAFSKVDIAYMAKDLDSKEEEVKNIVFNLILRGRLNGLVEADTNLLIMQKPQKVSPQLLNISELIQSMNKIVDGMITKTAIKITTPVSST